MNQPYSPQYLIDECNRFREVMCSTEYSIEQKDRAFEGLSTVYLQTNLDADNRETNAAKNFYLMIAQVEYPMRTALSVVMPVRQLLNAEQKAKEK